MKKIIIIIILLLLFALPGVSIENTKNIYNNFIQAKNIITQEKVIKAPRLIIEKRHNSVETTRYR